MPEIHRQEEIGSPATEDPLLRSQPATNPRHLEEGPIGLPRRKRDETLKLENLYHRPQVSGPCLYSVRAMKTRMRQMEGYTGCTRLCNRSRRTDRLNVRGP